MLMIISKQPSKLLLVELFVLVSIGVQVILFIASIFTSKDFAGLMLVLEVILGIIFITADFYLNKSNPK